jgi:hypothetical protein
LRTAGTRHRTLARPPEGAGGQAPQCARRCHRRGEARHSAARHHRQRPHESLNTSPSGTPEGEAIAPPPVKAPAPHQKGLFHVPSPWWRCVASSLRRPPYPPKLAPPSTISHSSPALSRSRWEPRWCGRTTMTSRIFLQSASAHEGAGCRQPVNSETVKIIECRTRDHISHHKYNSPKDEKT